MKLTKHYRNLMKSPNRTLLLLELSFKAIFLVFLLPLFNYSLALVMKRWGQSYITFENLPSFLRYPLTILLIFISLIIIPIYILIKMATMISFCDTAGAYHKTSLRSILSNGILRSLQCIISGNIILPLYALLLYIFTNIPILIGITAYARMTLKGGDADVLFIKGLIILGLIMIGFIAFPGIFVLHFCIHEHESFLSAMERSKKLLKCRGLRTAGRLTLYNIALMLVFILIYYSVLFLAAVLTFICTNRSLVIPVFLSVYPKIKITAAVIFSMLSFITNINLLSSLYQAYQEKDFMDNLPKDLAISYVEVFSPIRKHRYLLNTFLILIMTAGIANFYATIRNDSFYLKDTLTGIRVSSHRGNSYVAPENTLPALQNAIIANSDYAEIDIRQTKDGRIVLLHDGNLWRTAGMNRYIWEVTYDEIMHLDVGSWFGKEFSNTQIPTLEEALQLCKGKIKLNIEIKSGGVTKNIEGKLVELIRKYDFEHQCVVSSVNYASLKKVKLLDDNIKTGLVMTAAYGNFYCREYIDYYSIRSGFITESMVKSAHRAGKEIHAWTVNTASEIERMKSLGVDCIITNNPTLAKEILLRDDTNKTFIQLLNRMLYNKSFFSIVKGED